MPRYRMTRQFVSPPREGDELDELGEIEAENRPAACKVVVANCIGISGTISAVPLGAEPEPAAAL